MATFKQGEIVKKTAFFTETQFPALYKEFGQELIQLVEDYYRFLETETNQTVYNVRRMFEYRDISSTISSMIIHFQRMFLADLPLKPEIVPFVIKNILDLYRSKGTEQGIKSFFRIFYEEDIEVYYPAQQMFKPSASKWRTGKYLQMFPNDNVFFSKTGVKYTYLDLLGKNVLGSTSRARAAVNKINFILLNGIITPIIYIDEVKSFFVKYDDLLCSINGELVSFGRVNGSLNDIEIDTEWAPATTGNEIGDLVDVEGVYGVGGKAIVTELSPEITGTIAYEVIDGGFGYTVENTRLLVSDQIVILANPNLIFEPGEIIRDRFGNEGILTGQNELSFGVKMNPGENFNIEVNPELRRVSTNELIAGITDITIKNDSSPGILYPDGAPPDASTQVIADIINTISVSLITDPIQPFVAVPINSANYNAIPPATQAMSGSVDPVTLATPLNQAFDLTPFTIGTIDVFRNINPGVNYTNDVFALAQDSQMKIFERKDQILTLDIGAAATSFDVGEIVTEKVTNIQAIVKSTSGLNGTITITPYAYYGFSGNQPVVRVNGEEFDIIAVGFDYESRNIGDNAIIDADTLFAEGKIAAVKIFESGLGYVQGETAYLLNKDGIRAAKGTIVSQTQGTTEGFWSNFQSHLNGYEVSSANSEILTYFDGQARVQDSDYYQEYSYELKGRLNPVLYEDFYRKTMHLAGTKLFSNFLYQRKYNANVKQRFLRLFNDDGSGSPLDIGNTQILTSDFVNITSDMHIVTSDNDSSAGGGGGGGGGTPTYAISVQGGATSVDEGSSLTFVVNTTNVTGSLYWSVPNTGDFQFTGGNVIITNNSGAFQLTPLADLTTEGAETFTVSLHTGSSVGPVVATVGPITINDTSTTPAPFVPDYIINVTTPIFNYIMNGTHGGGSLVNQDQPILSFSAGDKVEFRIDAQTVVDHPFYLKTTIGSGTANQVPNVTGQGGAVLQWTAVAGTYYYQCAFHGSMNNIISVT